MQIGCYNNLATESIVRFAVRKSTRANVCSFSLSFVNWFPLRQLFRQLFRQLREACITYNDDDRTPTMGYDHHRQCIPYRYYYIYETAKLFPIGNIYPNIVKSTTNDQIEPDYEAIDR